MKQSVQATVRLDPLVEPFKDRFRCPECGSAPLFGAEDGLSCLSCGASYPIHNSVPVLLSQQSLAEMDRELSSDTGRAMLAEYAMTAETGSKPARKHLLDRLRPPDVLYHVNPELARPPACRLFDHQGPGTTVLNVGGGPRRYSDREVCLNLNAFLNVNAVGDAHNIPFMDDSFDSVFANAVLEHVYRPDQVISEMVRVLKPGGCLYAEIPFLFFFHGYPNDFSRMTREGIRRAFDALEAVEIGITNGPVSAFLLNANAFFQILLPKRPRLVRKAFNGVYRWALFPFKYFDRWAARLEDAHAVSGGFYVFGKKPAAAAAAVGERP